MDSTLEDVVDSGRNPIRLVLRAVTLVGLIAFLAAIFREGRILVGGVPLICLGVDLRSLGRSRAPWGAGVGVGSYRSGSFLSLVGGWFTLVTWAATARTSGFS